MAKRMGFNFMGGALMIVLLILMFSPYWYIGTEPTGISIQDYVWFPSHHKEMVGYMEDMLGIKKFDVTSIATMPVLSMLLCALGTIACIFKSRTAWASCFPTAAGLFGLIGYVMEEPLRLGRGWEIHVLVCAAIFAVGLAGLLHAIITCHTDPVTGKWTKEIVA